jgi:cytochrome c oxidase cbb3-type subunit III
MPTKIEKDVISGQDTTGHEWDGIKELNTPLPKWWVYVFYASILFAIVYSVLMPAWPSLSGHTDGTLGYSQRQAVAQTIADAQAARIPMLNRIKAAGLDDIRKDTEMLNFALAGGRAVFGDNCATCHGAGGAGAKGYPNLADDDWLWGGSIKDVHQTIAFGVRNANDKARASQMPRFGVDNVLNTQQINDVAEFVLSLNKREADKGAAERGAKVFKEQCVACHGENGQGNQELGAKRLNNNIWLYGGDKETIVKSISGSRNGNMPAWSERFDDVTVKMLAIYVHSLGGGQ